MFNRSRNFFLPTVFAFVFSVTLNFWAGAAHAASETEIDIKVEAALTLFKAEVLGGEEFLKRAKGILIFPDIIKAGLFIGGEYGEGALRIGGKTVAYYSTVAASIGFQLGVQQKAVMLISLKEPALVSFRASDG